MLALDTSVGTQSVARLEEDRIVALIGVSSGRGRSDQVLTLVDRVLELSATRASDLDVIAVSRGPGSLTGLRVGIGTARGIALGAGKRLVGVSSLQALAASAGGRAPVLALLDAGRGEVYGGLFRPGDPPVPLGEERIAPPKSFSEAVQGRCVRLVGSVAARCHELFPDAESGPPFVEEFLASGVGRVAAAMLREEEAARSGRRPPPDLGVSPRYLRRDAAPVTFED